MNKKITVLVVDDSRIFRSLIIDSLKKEKDIEVIGSVHNGQKAVEFIQTSRPDIITLDVEMPELDGLETLKAIQQTVNKGHYQKMGIIMLSAFTKKGAETTIKALEHGAFDFIEKPNSDSAQESMEKLNRQLMVKIRSYLTRNITRTINPSLRPPPEKIEFSPDPVRKQVGKAANIQAILIGVSTGGPQALSKILPTLCNCTDLPILIVQHMPPTFTNSLANNLNAKCSHTIIEASQDLEVQKKHVYIAPGGKHLLVREQRKQAVIHINDEPSQNGCKPSVDVLSRSASVIWQENTITVVLTGMGTDGTKGIAALKRQGSLIIAQDEASSVVWGMPGSAVASGNVDVVLPLDRIPGHIKKFLIRQ